MTVSPGWPQDAKGPSPEIANGGPPEAVAKEVLPPTLFQLPNLKSNIETSEPTILPSQGSDFAAASVGEPAQKRDQAFGADPNAVADLYAGADQKAGVTDRVFEVTDQESGAERSDVPAPPVSDATEGARASRLVDYPASSNDEDSIKQPIPPARLPIEVPAGRAWSESIGSQGIVIALLMVVVAAALMSRGGSDEDSTESALAEHSDLLEFDRGESIEIPGNEIAENGIPSAGIPSAGIPNAGIPGVGVTPETFSGRWATDSFSDQSPRGDLAVVSDDAEVASVTLDFPTADNSIAEAEATQSTALSAEDIRVNQFYSGSNQVEAQTVSSRSDAGGVSGLHDAANPAAAHRVSNTPVEMKNLLQYLPPLPESVTQAPAVGIGAQADPSYAK